MIKGSVPYVLCTIEDDSSLTPVSEHEDLSGGIKAGRHIVEMEDSDFSYSPYTADMVARMAQFAEGRIGYLEWARRYGRLADIHSLDDHLDMTLTS
jgi:hypothetical protein